MNTVASYTFGVDIPMEKIFITIDETKCQTTIKSNN